MKIVLLDVQTLGADIDISPLKKIGACIEYGSTLPESISERICNADVVIVNKVKLNENNLKGATHLKLICVAATGFDNIDTAFCRNNGIAVCNVPGYSTDSVAQLTLSMALSLATHLTEYRDFVHSGYYSQSDSANRLTPVYHEISSMTWGVVGGGGIGSRVASIAKAMGCHVLMCRRKKEKIYEQVSLDELCRRSDIISLHVPLNDETRGMINKERIAMMKKNAILINVARGAVCDEWALVQAILEGKLGGLGVDVYSSEPFPKDHPFTKLLPMQNVCLTPHMAWGSAEARKRCVAAMAQNIISFFDGKIHNRVDI